MAALIGLFFAGGVAATASAPELDLRITAASPKQAVEVVEAQRQTVTLSRLPATENPITNSDDAVSGETTSGANADMPAVVEAVDMPAETADMPAETVAEPYVYEQISHARQPTSSVVTSRGRCTQRS